MAFNPQIIPRTDFYPNTGVGVGIPFSNGAVFNITYTTQAATKNNITNFLLTEPGERFDNPTFGFGLRKYLFEQIVSDNLDALELDVANAISTYFPTVILNKMDFVSNPDSNTLTVQIYYSIPNQSINDQIEFNFS